MTVAARRNIIKRRMDDYLWRETDVTNHRLRTALQNIFGDFRDAAIVGGMVRDLARVGQTGFRSDVDLVVDASAGEIAELGKSVGARANAFGGFSLAVPGWNIDFWALETTWAVREGYVEAKCLRDFTKSTFFNYDAVIYHLRKREVLCDDSYVERLQQKVMDINLLPNPTIVGNLYRAVRRILLWELVPGPGLTAFIEDNLDNSSFADLVKVDKRKSSTPFLYKYSGAAELRNAVVSKEYRRSMATYYGEQLSLPGIEAHSTELPRKTFNKA